MPQQQGDMQHEFAMQKYIREHDRLKARAEASEENFRTTFADLIKQENVKRQLAADAQAATKDPNRNAGSRDLDALRVQSVNRGYHSDEVITGNEDRPWED
jgi:hypothetical protein